MFRLAWLVFLAVGLLCPWYFAAGLGVSEKPPDAQLDAKRAYGYLFVVEIHAWHGRLDRRAIQSGRNLE